MNLAIDGYTARAIILNQSEERRARLDAARLRFLDSRKTIVPLRSCSFSFSFYSRISYVDVYVPV